MWSPHDEPCLRAARRLSRLAVPCLLLLASGFAAAGPAATSPSWWRPVPDVSYEGWRPDRAFWYTTWITAFAFVLVLIALIGSSIRYRARPGQRATYMHGTDRKSFAVTGTLAALVFITIDMNLVRMSEKDMREFLYNFPSGPDVVKIEVMPQQWAWNIRYPGPDGKFGTADDVVTLNDMRVPADRPVMVNLKSKDVIHSFYLPSFKLKQDANPGSVTRTWFKARQPGHYEIACSQMCGWAHYKMRGELTVLTQSDYDRWLKEAEGDAARRHDPADKEANWAWEWAQ